MLNSGDYTLRQIQSIIEWAQILVIEASKAGKWEDNEAMITAYGELKAKLNA